MPLQTINLPGPTFPCALVFSFRRVGREEELNRGPRVLDDPAADLVRVDLVHQQVVDLLQRQRTI